MTRLTYLSNKPLVFNWNKTKKTHTTTNHMYSDQDAILQLRLGGGDWKGKEVWGPADQVIVLSLKTRYM